MTRYAAALAACALALAGCGLKGDLDTPAPLWGDPTRTAIDPLSPTMDLPAEEPLVFVRDRSEDEPPAPASDADAAPDPDADTP